MKNSVDPQRLKSPTVPRKNKIDTFENEIENSSIFNEINIVKIKEESDIINILLKITPDKSKSYGFGFGWEERTGVRCTFEYQKKNIFKSLLISSLLRHLLFYVPSILR